jgi:tRNA U34 5-carboxymethylaminomethyl modifying GTPase MnmE/TrmE
MDTNEQNYTIDQVIEASFDFSNYSEEDKQKVIAETSSMIMEAALVRSLTDASEQVQKAFQTLIAGEPNEEQMAEFVSNNFPKFQEAVVTEIDIFLNSADAETVASAA